MMRTGTPQRRSGLGGESAAVAGLAHRRGGDDREVIDGQGARQRDEALQIGKGQFGAIRVQFAGTRDAAPERARSPFH